MRVGTDGSHWLSEVCALELDCLGPVQPIYPHVLRENIYPLHAVWPLSLKSKIVPNL